MAAIQPPNPVIDDRWRLAIRKTLFVVLCMIIAYFIVVFATILYYFFFSILTYSQTDFPGMEVWQPFWTLAIVVGFLLGMFKSIIDLLEEKEKQEAPVSSHNEGGD